jgi:DNA replication and repair protein RecF
LNEERRRRLRLALNYGSRDALARSRLGRPGNGQDETSVILRELVLVNFRNYVRLALRPGEAMTVLLGDNGQGKSNILEAIYVLATTRSPRAGSDRELVHWRARRDAIPFARLEARIDRQDAGLHLEILIKAESDAAGVAANTDKTVPSIRPVSKQIKVNGLPTRAVELVGQVNVVLFTPDDVALVAGSPSGRRRYLDITCSQVSGQYLRALQRFNHVLVQRNHLLRQVRDRRQPRDQLEYWNGEMVRLGSIVTAQRLEMVRYLNQDLGSLYRDLGGSQHDLQVAYHPASIDQAAANEAEADLPERYAARVRDQLQREIDQGVSLVGPHRDDFAFVVDGVDLNTYGSRGQQRLAVLAIKLAEGKFMRAQTGERPILLLDDILSELDPTRRGFVLEQAGREGQTVITTTDLGDFTETFLAGASAYRVEHGTISSIESGRPQPSANGHVYEAPPASGLHRVAEPTPESPSNVAAGEPGTSPRPAGGDLA